MRLLVSSFLAAALVACVSDNGQTGPKQGELGGACFANNTCKDTLVCTLVNGSGVCQQADGSASDATSDQGVPDSVVPGGDGGNDGEAGTPCAEQASRACLGTQCAGTVNPECCTQSGQCVTNSTGCAGNPTWTCTARSDCTSGFCCIAGSVAQASTCPPIWMVNGGATCSANDCTGSFYEVCSTANDCPTSHPTCTAVNIQGVTQILGLCL